MCDDENELVDIEEVMETLNIGRNTVYSLLKSGSLEAFRIGRMWKIPRGSNDKQLHVQEQLPALNHRGLYIVKGDSPFCLLHFKAGFYLYTSTEEIMAALLQKQKCEKVEMKMGDILHIQVAGKMALGNFHGDSKYIATLLGLSIPARIGQFRVSRGVKLNENWVYQGKYAGTKHNSPRGSYRRTWRQ